MPTSRRSFFSRLFNKPTPAPMPRSVFADPYLCEILIVPYNFAPRGWAFCNGQLLNIASNAALFAILGTTYGGNGTTTFALPNLNGRAPIGVGQGPALPNYTLGQTTGAETHTLTVNQMPTQAISFNEIMVRGTGGTQGTGLAKGGVLGNTTLNVSGDGQAHNNMPPYLVMNYIIALQGVFPPRS
jgi:microcystin-dependent protein